jgi:hypothetical protein
MQFYQILTNVASASAGVSAAKWRTNFSSWLMSAAEGIGGEVLAFLSAAEGASPLCAACACPAKS